MSTTVHDMTFNSDAVVVVDAESQLHLFRVRWPTVNTSIPTQHRA
jgi:hypothetical protein